jgi:hypothetical protein
LKILGEVWAGRACAIANEKELTTCVLKGGLEFEKRGGICTKKGALSTPRLAGEYWSPTGRNRSLTDCGLPFFLQYFSFILPFSFGSLEMGLAF